MSDRTYWVVSIVGLTALAIGLDFVPIDPWRRIGVLALAWAMVMWCWPR